MSGSFVAVKVRGVERSPELRRKGVAMSGKSSGDGVKRSRRALLAGATGAVGVLAAKSLARTPAAEATQGQPVIAGFNNSETLPTRLVNTNTVNTDALIATAAQAGTGVKGTSSGGWGVRGEGGGAQGGGGGLYALGQGRGTGLEAHGGSGGGLGVYAWGAGVYAAVKARGQTSGDFVYFEPDETGVVGVGGDNDGPGIVGNGGGTGGTGVVGMGAGGFGDVGPAPGVSGYGNGFGPGVVGHGGPSGGVGFGVRGQATKPACRGRVPAPAVGWWGSAGR
jgi:hypothetical protein